MISLNVVSHKSVRQPLLPCKYQNPVTDGRRGAWGQRGQAVPGKPPTFSSAELSLPPFCPKGLEFPVRIPGFLPPEGRFCPTPQQLGSSCKCLCPRPCILRPSPTTPQRVRHRRVCNKLLLRWRKQKRCGSPSNTGEVWMGQSRLSHPFLFLALYRTPFLTQILPVSLG